MSQPVSTTLNSGALALGVSRDYWQAYDKAEADALNGYLGGLVLDVQGVGDHWKGAYFESSPIARRWRRGELASSQSFKDVGWTVQVKDWEQKVTWRWSDAMDDQTQSLVAIAQSTGRGFWQRDESNWFQILEAGTDTAGLEALPTAADGVAMFSATDGAGANRFGVSGGNIVSGQAFATGAGIRAGFQAAVARMLQFTDTVGQPYFRDAKRFLVIGSAVDLAVYNEAFKQTFMAIGANTATSNAAVSNVIVEAGYQATVWITPRVATTHMYVVNLDAPVKPLVRVNRQKPTEIPINMANSDLARATGEEGLQWIARTGYGVGLPINSIRVTT